MKRTSTFAEVLFSLDWAGLPPKKLRMSVGIVQYNAASAVMELIECAANKETMSNEQRVVVRTSSLTRVSNVENRECRDFSRCRLMFGSSTFGFFEHQHINLGQHYTSIMLEPRIYRSLIAQFDSLFISRSCVSRTVAQNIIGPLDLI
jgi:hypothetical protein